MECKLWNDRIEWRKIHDHYFLDRLYNTFHHMYFSSEPIEPLPTVWSREVDSWIVHKFQVSNDTHNEEFSLCNLLFVSHIRFPLPNDICTPSNYWRCQSFQCTTVLINIPNHGRTACSKQNSQICYQRTSNLQQLYTVIIWIVKYSARSIFISYPTSWWRCNLIERLAQHWNVIRHRKTYCPQPCKRKQHVIGIFSVLLLQQFGTMHNINNRMHVQKYST